MTEPIDVYSEWIDAADAAQKEANDDDFDRSALASSSRARQRAEVSDED